MNKQPASIWKSSLKYGISLGLISVVFSLIIWSAKLIEELGLFGSGLLGIFSLVISFIILLIFTRMYRNKELDGYISFNEAFQFGLLVVLVGTIITTIYNLLFHTVIDPGYTEHALAVMQQKTLDFMEGAGLPDSQIEETLNRLDDTPTLLESLRQGFVTSLISGVILSLITAAIVKKNQTINQ